MIFKGVIKMYITLRVYFEHLGGKLMKKGNFPVNVISFRKNEMKEVTRIASKFVQQIELEIGPIKLEKVIYNGEQDITDFIKK